MLAPVEVWRALGAPEVAPFAEWERQLLENCGWRAESCGALSGLFGGCRRSQTTRQIYNACVNARSTSREKVDRHTTRHCTVYGVVAALIFLYICGVPHRDCNNWLCWRPAERNSSRVSWWICAWELMQKFDIFFNLRNTLASFVADFPNEPRAEFFCTFWFTVIIICRVEKHKNVKIGPRKLRSAANGQQMGDMTGVNIKINFQK